ncbi:MAG TPA: hypothetical protein VMW64_03435 [Dehalococcoidia bacterium]|nr:hypothetical protein [Dehalococcoidia bacterium]
MSIATGHRDVMLQINRVGTQEMTRNVWVATVEPHIVKEDLETPGFWANIAPRFVQFDRIEVRQDDGKFFAEYLILNCDRTSAQVHELSWVDLSTKAKPEKQSLYVYKFRGPHGKHSIVRTSDGALMTEKLESKDAALKWLTEYLETTT